MPAVFSKPIDPSKSIAPSKPIAPPQPIAPPKPIPIINLGGEDYKILHTLHNMLAENTADELLQKYYALNITTPLKSLTIAFLSIQSELVSKPVLQFLLKQEKFDVNARFNFLCEDDVTSKPITLYNDITLFFSAAYTGEIQLVQLLMEHGADPLVRNVNGETALHLLTQSHRTEIIKKIIAVPLIRDRYLSRLLAMGMPNANTTVLAYSVIHGYVDLVEIYLNAKADPCQTDIWGTNALHWAVSYGFRFIAIEPKDWLKSLAQTMSDFSSLATATLDDTATISAFNRHKTLHAPAYNAIIDLLWPLVPLDARTKQNEQAVHYAAANGNYALMQRFFDKGIPLNIEGYFGTPLDYLILAFVTGAIDKFSCEVSLRKLMLQGAYSSTKFIQHFLDKKIRGHIVNILLLLAQDPYTTHSVILATRSGDHETLTKLVEKIDDPILLTSALFNALVFASREQFAICTLLISQGARLDLTMAGYSLSDIITIAVKDKESAGRLEKLCTIKSCDITTPSGLPEAEKFSSKASRAVSVAPEKLINDINRHLNTIIGFLFCGNSKEAQIHFIKIEKLLDELLEKALDPGTWENYCALQSQYQQLQKFALRANTLSASDKTAVTPPEAVHIIYIPHLRQRLMVLLNDYSVSTPSETKASIILQIHYNLVHILEAKIKTTRIVFYLRQLLVHQAYLFDIYPEYILELARFFALDPEKSDPLSLLTQSQFVLQVQNLECTKKYIATAKKRPIFTDKRDYTHVASDLINLSNTLANCDDKLKSSVGAKVIDLTQLDMMELARSCVYRLRDILRDNPWRPAWTNPHRTSLLLKLEMIAGKALVNEWREAICDFANHEIHNHHLMLNDTAFEEISTTHLLKIIALCDKMQKAGVNLEKLLMPMPTTESSAATAIYSASGPGSASIKSSLMTGKHR